MDGWEKLIDAATQTTLATVERQERLREHRQERAQHDLDDDWEPCWRCNGHGWGIVGVDWDCEDAINGPYDGETEKCHCCGGSGKADDCTFW